MAETIDIDGDDEDFENGCVPIMCDDEGPDFSKMIKKNGASESSAAKTDKVLNKELDPSSMQSLDKISNLDLRRRFEIDKTKKKDVITNQSVAISDMLNPLAESLTGEQLKFHLEQ